MGIFSGTVLDPKKGRQDGAECGRKQPRGGRMRAGCGRIWIRPRNPLPPVQISYRNLAGYPAEKDLSATGSRPSGRCGRIRLFRGLGFPPLGTGIRRHSRIVNSVITRCGNILAPTKIMPQPAMLQERAHKARAYEIAHAIH